MNPSENAENMVCIYTHHALIRLGVPLERLCEMVTEPAGDLRVSILPFGSHNPVWKENRETFDKLTVRGFFDRPSIGWPLGAADARAVNEALANRFIGPIIVYGPTLDRHDQVVQWLMGVAYGLMRYGDEPNGD